MLTYYGDTTQKLHKRLIEINYGTRKHRDPAKLLRENAVASFQYARALGFATDPLDPTARRPAKAYKIGFKFLAEKRKAEAKRAEVKRPRFNRNTKDEYENQIALLAVC